MLSVDLATRPDHQAFVPHTVGERFDALTARVTAEGSRLNGFHRHAAHGPGFVIHTVDLKASWEAMYQIQVDVVQSAIGASPLQSNLTRGPHRLRHPSIPGTRRERIVGAVEAGGKYLTAQYEAWISADPFSGAVRVLITGPQTFELMLQFSLDEEPREITHRVRATLEE